MKINIGKKNGKMEEEANEGLGSVDTGIEASEQKIAELEQSLQEAKEQTLRRTAEMENMRRRFQQEREVLIFEGNKRLLTDLLSTLDDLERTLEHARKSDAPSLVEGLDLVHKNFLKLLERYGVKPMETVGKEFDVHLHDALMEEVRDDVEPGTITNEVQRGYMLNENVLRHAKVIVAKKQENQ
jgi:molecular chaperone GrpE